MRTHDYAKLFLLSEPAKAIRASLARRAAARVRQNDPRGLRTVYAEIGLPALVAYFQRFKMHNAERVAGAVLGLMLGGSAK